MRVWTTLYSNLSQIAIKTITQDNCIINGYVLKFGDTRYPQTFFKNNLTK